MADTMKVWRVTKRKLDVLHAIVGGSKASLVDQGIELLLKEHKPNVITATEMLLDLADELDPSIAHTLKHTIQG